MVVVCLLLLALISVVQVAHLHQSATDADHCALCTVMHSAVPVTSAAVLTIILIQLGVSMPNLRMRAEVRYWHPQLFTRPPPPNSF